MKFTGLGTAVGRVFAPRSGATGFDPGPRHTKVFTNRTSCSLLGTWFKHIYYTSKNNI